MNIDRVIESIADDYLTDRKGNNIYVGDVVMVAYQGLPVIGIVKKIYKKVKNFTVIPYNISADEKYIDFNKKRFYPRESMVVNFLFNSDITTNKKLVETAKNEKQFEKVIYAYFKEYETNFIGLVAFNIYSQKGKRFCKDDIVRGAKEIVEKYGKNYKLKFFTNDNDFIDSEADYENIYFADVKNRGCLLTCFKNPSDESNFFYCINQTMADEIYNICKKSNNSYYNKIEKDRFINDFISKKEYYNLENKLYDSYFYVSSNGFSSWYRDFIVGNAFFKNFSY